MSSRPGDGAMPPPAVPPSVTSPSAPPPDPTVLWMLILLTVLLMGFSIGMWLLGNVTLAAAAGTGALALVVDIARRLLTAGPPPAHPQPRQEIPSAPTAAGTEVAAPTPTREA